MNETTRDQLSELGSASALFVGVCTGIGHAHLAVLLGGLSVASVATVIMIGQGLNPWLGVVPGALTAVLFLGAFRTFSRPQGVHPGEYQELVDRLDNLDIPECRDYSCVRRHVSRLREDLRTRGAHWLSGYGYLNAWRRLHYAEEETALCASRQHVREMAIADVDRLHASKMEQAGRLLDRAEKAADDLGIGRQEPDARHDVHYVRGEVNRYREDRWRALIEYRDQLMTATALLWVLLYAALVVSVSFHAGPPRLAVATFFFIVGAVIGLLSQLYNLAQQDPAQAAVEDFGLSIARLLGLPAFSGAIGLAGVVVVAALQLEVNGQHLAPVAKDGVDWAAVFDWRANGVGFAWAALFALAPGRLFDLLRNAKQLKTEIHSVEASGASR